MDVYLYMFLVGALFTAGNLAIGAFSRLAGGLGGHGGDSGDAGGHGSDSGGAGGHDASAGSHDAGGHDAGAGSHDAADAGGHGADISGYGGESANHDGYMPEHVAGTEDINWNPVANVGVPGTVGSNSVDHGGIFRNQGDADASGNDFATHGHNAHGQGGNIETSTLIFVDKAGFNRSRNSNYVGSARRRPLILRAIRTALRLLPLRPTALMSFLTVAGGVGSVTLRSGVTAPLAHSLAIGTGYALSMLIGVALPNRLRLAQNTSAPERSELIGIKAKVIARIAKDGFGRISYVSRGNAFSAPARHIDGDSVSQGADVAICEIRGSTYYVFTLSALQSAADGAADGAGSQAEARR